MKVNSSPQFLENLKITYHAKSLSFSSNNNNIAFLQYFTITTQNQKRIYKLDERLKILILKSLEKQTSLITNVKRKGTSFLYILIQ